MEIRKVTPNDNFDAIGNIYSASWRAAYRGIVPQEYLDGLNGSHWSSVLANSEYDAIVLLDGNKYVGASSFCAARDTQMAGWGEIVSIYLLPEYFGKGCAKPLMDCVIAALADDGYKDIYLWVLDQNIRAQKFYKKHGFFASTDCATITIGGKDLTEIRYIKHLEE